MLEFQDNHPLNPPPAVGDDWATPPDRNAHDAVEESRAFLQELSELLRGLKRDTITLPDGRVMVGIFQWAGSGLPSIDRWDIVPANDGWKLYAPKAIVAANDVTAYIPLTNDAFVTPAAGQWLVARIESVTTPEIVIKLVDEWDGFPSPYLFDDTSFDLVMANLPLYEFHGEEVEGSFVLVEGIWAEKKVIGGIANVIFDLVPVPEQPILRSVPRMP